MWAKCSVWWMQMCFYIVKGIPLVLIEDHLNAEVSQSHSGDSCHGQHSPTVAIRWMCMSTLKAVCDVINGSFIVKLNETHVAWYIIALCTVTSMREWKDIWVFFMLNSYFLFLFKKRGFRLSTLSCQYYFRRINLFLSENIEPVPIFPNTFEMFC